MNKAGKHIQSGATTQMSGNDGVAVSGVSLLASPTTSPTTTTQFHSSQKNVINSIMSFLPDNRPITSLQIVEDHEKCPRNFVPVHRSYDQDADADLWRETNRLFGRPTTRYLCLSKTEGLPEYVVETLKVISEKIQPPKEFSLLSRTADTEQKAWRKRQIAYKLSKRGTVTHAVTDIILCSKLKIAPDGFKLAGDINGVLVCYKTGAIPVRLPPPIPGGNLILNSDNCSEVEKALNRINLNGNNNNNINRTQALPHVLPVDNDHDYEEILASYQINSPQRPAPKPPMFGSTISAAAQTSGASVAVACTNTSGHNLGTLGAYTELDGVPFIMNPTLKQISQLMIPTLPDLSDALTETEYDFQLERQILCTMKSSASKNPFFQ